MAVLRALARGDAELARAGGLELAAQVLAAPLVRLAAQVLAGGEWMDQRIAELCLGMIEARDVAAKRGAA